MPPTDRQPANHPAHPETNPQAVVDRYFRAMQAGRAAKAELFALFAEDATYIEPFTGAPRTHRGITAIETAFEESWKNPPPDLAIKVERVDLDGDQVRSEWVCTSPAFPGPVRGYDLCQVRDGRIARLEVNLIGAAAAS